MNSQRDNKYFLKKSDLSCAVVLSHCGLINNSVNNSIGLWKSQQLKQFVALLFARKHSRLFSEAGCDNHGRCFHNCLSTLEQIENQI